MCLAGLTSVVSDPAGVQTHIVNARSLKRGLLWNIKPAFAVYLMCRLRAHLNDVRSMHAVSTLLKV